MRQELHAPAMMERKAAINSSHWDLPVLDSVPSSGTGSEHRASSLDAGSTWSLQQRLMPAHTKYYIYIIYTHIHIHIYPDLKLVEHCQVGLLYGKLLQRHNWRSLIVHGN